MDAATGLKKFLVNSALNSKYANLKNSGKVTHGLWDKIVFKRAKAALGG